MFKYISIVCITLLSLTLTARHLSAVIVVDGDFVSGPTGSPPTSTDPTFWTGGGDPNTDPNVPPSTDGIIGVTGNGSLTINGGSNLNVNHLDLGQDPGASGTVNVTGAGSTLNVAVHFHIGAHADDASTLDGGNGMVSITSGGVIDVGGDIWLGDSGASSGTAVVDGTGSILRTGDDLFVGDDGMGSLTVRNGGVVEATDEIKVGDDSGGDGNLMVDGPGSVVRALGRDFDIGDDGVGQALVTNGGRIEAGDDIQIANDTGSSGSTLTVQGPTSTIFAVDDIRVGDEDQGSLILSAGARAEAAEIIVGGNQAGIGTMIVEGSGTAAVATSSDFIAGGSGRGTVTIRDGGRVEAVVVRLGDNVSGDGVINVQGPSSIITSADSYLIGFGGKGNLNVSNGGRAEAIGAFFLGLDPGGVGHVTVTGAGSTLETTGDNISFGPQGGDGHLFVLDGATVTAFDGIDIGVDVTSNSSATVSGSNSLITSDSITAGLLGSGTLNVFDGGRATTSTNVTLANETGSLGTVNVRGVGSQVSTSILEVGVDGTGTLNLSESGSVSSETAAVTATSSVNMVVSSNNMLAASTSYTNNGTTNFIAGSQLAVGSYTPINSPSFLGAGSYVGIGGTTSFPAGVPTFTVGPIITDDGDGVQMSLNGGDRVQFGNVTVALNENVGTDGSLTVADLGLSSALGNPALLSFSFLSSGLDTSLLNALSFNVGQQDRETLRVLQRATGAGDDAWVLVEPVITDYTNGAFTFTVNELNGFDYAIVAIPESSAFISVGLAGLVASRRRSRHTR